MGLNSQQREIIRRCQKSAIWFMRNFVKVKHPGAGIVPFHPFEYQQNAIRSFRKFRKNIFRKTRQCFPGETLVHTPTKGKQRIDSLGAGDHVMTFKPEWEDFRSMPIEEVYKNPPGELCLVSADGHHSVTTLDHRYFTDKGPVEAANLTPDHYLLGTDDDISVRWRRVHEVVKLGPSTEPLYDLRVPPFDNYVVDGAVVHNCGISKVSGAFALWFGMFSAHKTILIVSRKDDDAMSFLNDNIKLPFSYLPEWMKDVWKPVKDNEHELVFPNGSKIKSLTSHPDVLRSNASSLNIIDEAAFINDMDAMWASGRPTLQHGGSVIVISTTNGVGNWYWNTWTDAEAGANDFNPLIVNWWDMKWSIEYTDSLSGQKTKIAPTDGIVPTAKGTFSKHKKYNGVELRPEIYGPFWSPWLEEQYRDLQEKGEGWKFDQEILAAFVGSGNTVISKEVLVHVGNTVSDQFEVITGVTTYVHPVTGDSEELDFTPNEPNEGMWVWRPPVLATPDKVMGGRVIERGTKAHSYVMGVDIATGKGKDYHALEIFDIDKMEQAAEGMFHCLPATFKKMVDRIGRWYNCALAVVERNNGGDIIIDDLATEFNYPRLWRKSEFNGKTVTMGQLGFFTSSASKAAMNKFLLDYIRDKDGEGFRIYSRRLLKQMNIYVRRRDKAGRDTGKTEAEAGAGNHDDLVMALALAMIGVPDSYGLDSMGSLPFLAQQLSTVPANPAMFEQRRKEFIEKGGVLMPLSFGGDDPEVSAQEELLRFTSQLGGLPMLVAMRNQFAVVNKKHQF